MKITNLQNNWRDYNLGTSWPTHYVISLDFLSWKLLQKSPMISFSLIFYTMENKNNFHWKPLDKIHSRGFVLEDNGKITKDNGKIT